MNNNDNLNNAIEAKKLELKRLIPDAMNPKKHRNPLDKKTIKNNIVSALRVNQFDIDIDELREKQFDIDENSEKKLELLIALIKDSLKCKKEEDVATLSKIIASIVQGSIRIVGYKSIDEYLNKSDCNIDTAVELIRKTFQETIKNNPDLKKNNIYGTEAITRCNFNYPELDYHPTKNKNTLSAFTQIAKNPKLLQKDVIETVIQKMMSVDSLTKKMTASKITNDNSEEAYNIKKNF